MNYENYKVFIWTDKQLKKHYSKEILDKYYKILAFLYQNGFDINSDSIDEIDEQLKDWNYFQSIDDLEELIEINGIESDYAIGKKIISEELYDIIKESVFLRKEADNPVSIKSYANTYWSRIGENLQRLEELLSSKDIEIFNGLKAIKNINNIKEKVSELKEKYEKGVKVLTWIKSVELINIVYSTYIQLSKIKTDTINISKASNLNDELYGSIGGFNPNTGEIKCIIGSAVWELKTAKNSQTMTKIKTIASSILENRKTGEDDEGIAYLDKWNQGLEKDDDLARKVVVCSLLYGIISLLSLKHSLNFLSEERNSTRAETIKYELKKIMEYCEISIDYLI